MKIKEDFNEESNINNNFNNNSGKCDYCDSNKHIKKNCLKKDLTCYNYNKSEHLKSMYKNRPLEKSIISIISIILAALKKRNIIYRAIILLVENNNSRKIYKTFQILINQNKLNE